MKAVRLKQVDMDYRNHLQAFLNFAVQAKKETGKNKSKPVYSRFQRFYDYDAALQKALGKQTETQESQILTRVKEFERRRRDGGEL